MQHVSVLPSDRGGPRASAWVPQDDVPFVEAAQRGDAAAFDQLYRRHARVVHGVLLARATRPDVEDLVQDVFIAAWRHLATLRDPAAFGGWIVAVARRQRIDHARRAASRPATPVSRGGDGTDASPLDHLASPAADPATRLEAEQALAAIQSLPEAYRETLVLRLVEGLSGPEIAARTGLTPESVRVNLCRGMKLLRALLIGGPPAVRLAHTR